MIDIEPIAMKANDKRVLLNGLPIGLDFRIISEANYQILFNESVQNTQLRADCEVARMEAEQYRKLYGDLLQEVKAIRAIAGNNIPGDEYYKKSGSGF